MSTEQEIPGRGTINCFSLYHQIFANHTNLNLLHVVLHCVFLLYICFCRKEITDTILSYIVTLVISQKL